MKLNKYILFFFLVFSSASLFASFVGLGKIQIKGNVSAFSTQTPLSDVNVEVDGKTLGTITDAKGNFVMWVDALPVSLNIDHPEHVSKTISIEQKPNNVLSVTLKKSEVSVSK